ncbi:AraC-like DNA-binding protein [Paenochrobactrum gallinarii]|uniref:AraC-like DNA-binding protein n=1 Tax=Paenochrobactrum gallinarii TaxID=643673 RepID=A0A841M0H2_9HYPH|nr:AraC family transcriptional regulator [Paenochrobactrum gallinarii]MBB6262262.1 AraC-like DNA-binding protein [Paenochrobactrum gallinarii]
MTEIRELRPNSSTEPTRAISIHIAREHLIQSFGLKPDLWQEEHRDAFFNRDNKSFSMANPLTPEMWLALDAVIDCKLEGTIRNLYLKAKAHELIILTAMLFNDINRPGHSSALASDERDRRLISIAAHIYRRELHNPPSIEELSRRIGMNRNKLTLGFRTLYGSTPAEYSRNIRLRWAERRLIEGIAINQVSLEAGYDSISAFSRAFKSRYGYSPSEVITGSMQADFNNYS